MIDDAYDIGHEESSSEGDEPVDNDSEVTEDDPIIGKEQQRLVSFGRVAVALVLLGSAALISFFTFSYLHDADEDEFGVQFNSDASQLLEAVNNKVMAALQNLEALGMIMTVSAALDGAATWPFVTLADFGPIARQHLELSGSSHVIFSPVVSNDNLTRWEKYSIQNQWWIQDDYDSLNVVEAAHLIPDNIHPPMDTTADEVSPGWQMVPPPTDTSIVNFNLLSLNGIKRGTQFAAAKRKPTLGFFDDQEFLIGIVAADEASQQSVATIPIFGQLGSPESEIVGHVFGLIPWSTYFHDILQEQHEVLVVIRESCGRDLSYLVQGHNATFVGDRDAHDPAYAHLGQKGILAPSTDDAANAFAVCDIFLNVYPTEASEKSFQSNNALIFTIGVLGVFLFTSLIFLAYDRFVQKRQNEVLSSAARTNAIVSSLFPAIVREKLYGEAHRKNVAMKKKMRLNRGKESDTCMEEHDAFEAPPIADLFPNSSVLFADIAGFTAWSSTREPCQVFVLLETIYSTFDKLANYHKVFKVETIGDCYVAAVGLPEPCEDHALCMARFARDIHRAMHELAHRLESTLGPDTAELCLRVGIHSGPVTAGVLRGERARFQLFGDTVNTASRMESTGMKKKIQISKETADLIISAGKANWVQLRDDTVQAKGKGELQTYWLLTKGDSQSRPINSSMDELDDIAVSALEEDEKPIIDEVTVVDGTVALTRPEKIQRMVDWNCDMLAQLLRRVVAKRQGQPEFDKDSEATMKIIEQEIGKIGTCLDEVAESIVLPKFDGGSSIAEGRVVELPEEVMTQLHGYVSIIASMYRNNAFHNFEHASHVTMSTCKLLSRIVAPKQQAGAMEGEQLHDHTYGITSDPLAQFAVVFSSLIHDVDHRGVPNHVLIEEDPALGSVYRKKSVAEQNSVDVAWDLLMDPDFDILRRAIYTNEIELKRFRQLIINAVLATDIFDKELGALRRSRWNRAFDVEVSDDEADIRSVGSTSSSLDILNNRKATIVIEHLIQASDVSHTMQHWHVYTKWNERLYSEMFAAYVEGRSKVDPTSGWYEGELGFFDNYVIPLAKKLKDCGVFGVSSDEYLDYAERNRKEWAAKGQETVMTMNAKFKRRFAKKSLDTTIRSKTSSKGSLSLPKPIHESLDLSLDEMSVDIVINSPDPVRSKRKRRKDKTIDEDKLCNEGIETEEPSTPRPQLNAVAAEHNESFPEQALEKLAAPL